MNDTQKAVTSAISLFQDLKDEYDLDDSDIERLDQVVAALQAVQLNSNTAAETAD